MVPYSLRRSLFASALATASLLLGCSEGGVPRPVGSVGIAVAPLTLSGVVDACYTIAVLNESNETVWTRTDVCASAYGDDKASISYVGPCDATDVDLDGTAYGTVRLVVQDLYRSGGPGNPPVSLAPSDWRNPCPGPIEDGLCAMQIACAENSDAAVRFSLTIMRKAYQGFFDIAVDFDNIFCSAKVDCTYPGVGGAPEIGRAHV